MSNVSQGRPVPPAAGEGWLSLLAAFPGASLADAEQAALLDRVDVKYALDEDQLVRLLARLGGRYEVLDIAGTRLHPYQTVYFDTPEFDLYRAHHAERANRYKVRSRRYVESGLTYLEVKLRTKRGRTLKQRLPTDGLVTEIEGPSAWFVASAIPAPLAGLRPTLESTFGRATLLDGAAGERVTIDTGITFAAAGRTVSLPGLAIAEVKTPGNTRLSALAREMRQLGIRPSSFSKYCIGVALLYEEVKHNRFNRQLAVAEMLGGRDLECRTT